MEGSSENVNMSSHQASEIQYKVTEKLITSLMKAMVDELSQHCEKYTG